MGDLESPLEVLELLVNSSAFSGDLGLELQSDPLASLFSVEEARYKPPPPLSPVITPKSKKSSKKRDRKGERSRSKKARNRTTSAGSASVEAAVIPNQLPEEGGGQVVLQRMKVEADAEPRISDLREPRTRASIAAAVAFEIEAHGGVLPEEEGKEAGVISTALSGFEFKPGTAPPESSSAGPGPGPPKQQKKRPSMSLPPSTTPRVVEDVDNQDSFQFFNSGWILPPDTKRHGRAPVEKQSMPPPRKRQKTGMFIFSMLPLSMT